MSGADIANVCNEAAIVGARRAADAVTMGGFCLPLHFTRIMLTI